MYHYSQFVGQRFSVDKVEAKGIFPNSDVTVGKDEEYDLESMTGKVIMDHRADDDIPVGEVLVEWCDESSSSIYMKHRLGLHGKVWETKRLLKS